MDMKSLFLGKPKHKEGVIERCQILGAGGMFSPTIYVMIKLVDDENIYRMEADYTFSEGREITAALTNEGDRVSFDYTDLLSTQIKASTFKNHTLAQRHKNAD